MNHLKKSSSGEIIKVLLALSLGINIVAGFFLFYQYQNTSITGKKKKEREKDMAIYVHKVSKGEILQQKTFSGNVRAVHGADLAFVHNGILEYIGFKPGTFVKKGTLLLGLRDGEQQANYHEAVANEKHAKFAYEQVQKLYEKGYQPKIVMEEKKAAYETAKAKVMAAQSNLKNTKIYAPFDGIVGILDSETVIGKPVEVNRVLVRLIKGNALEVDFSPSETDVKHLSKGQVVMILPNDQGTQHPVRAIIQAIDSYSDSGTHTVKVRALIKESAAFLRDGVAVTVSANIGTRKNVLIVPKDCVEGNNKEGFSVYQIIAQNGQLYAVPKGITLGFSDLYSYEVEEGLELGTIVASDASRFSGYSAPVSILPDDPLAKELKEKMTQSASEKDHYSHALKNIEKNKNPS